MSLTIHWAECICSCSRECLVCVCVCVLQFYWAVNIEWSHITTKTGTHKAERVNATTITEAVWIGKENA